MSVQTNTTDLMKTLKEFHYANLYQWKLEALRGQRPQPRHRRSQNPISMTMSNSNSDPLTASGIWTLMTLQYGSCRKRYFCNCSLRSRRWSVLSPKSHCSSPSYAANRQTNKPQQKYDLLSGGNHAIFTQKNEQSAPNARCVPLTLRCCVELQPGEYFAEHSDDTDVGLWI